MNYQDPFLTIKENGVILDFLFDELVDDIIHVLVNDRLVFKGRYNELIYRIYILEKNLCELNFKKVILLHLNGDELSKRLYFFVKKRKEK